MDQDVRHVNYSIVQAAPADEDRYFEPPGEVGSIWRCSAIRFIPATAVTKDASDFVALTVYKVSTSMASLTTEDTTGGISLVAGTPVAMTTTAAEFTVGTHYLKANTNTTGVTGKVLDGTLRARWEHISG